MVLRETEINVVVSKIKFFNVFIETSETQQICQRNQVNM